MSSIKIEGVPPWDGDYPFDLSYFTNRELHVIKEISGIRAGELTDEFGRGNNDLIVAIAVIASKRAGREIPIDDLWDAEAGTITLVGEDDAGPPVQPASGETTGESPLTSGGDSVSTGETSPSPPSVIGDPGSGSDATSVSETLVP